MTFEGRFGVRQLAAALSTGSLLPVNELNKGPHFTTNRFGSPGKPELIKEKASFCIPKAKVRRH